MGLFDQYFQDPVRAAREQRAAEAVKRGPLAQGAYDIYMAREEGDRGLRQAAGALTGIDMRTAAEKHAEDVKSLQAELQAAGHAPGTPEFFDTLAKGLQARGMTDQAIEVAKRAEEMRMKRAEEKRKVVKTEADIAATAERNAIARERLAGAPAETERLLGLYDQAVAEGNAPRAEAITRRLNEMAKGSGVKFNNLGDRMDVVDAATGARIRTDIIGAKPESAKDIAKRETKESGMQIGYDQSMLKMQAIYDSIVRLAQHPGTVKLVGWLTGKAGDVGDEKLGGVASEAALAAIGDEGRAALELYRQIGGQAFLGALADLKRESQAAGAKGTGLGALSDAEGRRVVQAAGALGLRQTPESFYKALTVYAGEITKSVELINAQAQRDGLTVKPFNAPAIAMPSARRAPRSMQTVPTAAPAPAAPARGGWKARELK